MDSKTASQNVTPQELIEFFMANNVNPNCPTCGHDQSSIQVDDNQKYVRVLANEYVEMQPHGSFSRVTHMMFPSILTACDRCGFMRTFSLAKVNTWLNKQHPNREAAAWTT